MTERQSALDGTRILLLEDDALISIDTADMLHSFGVADVLVAHTIEEAERILAAQAVDAAVLDLVIGQNRCESLAEGLVRDGVPVIFASGSGDPDGLPPGLRQVPRVEKPYSGQALHGALSGVIARPR